MGRRLARQAVIPEALRVLGVDVDAAPASAHDRGVVAVLGHGREVGRIEPLGMDAVEFLTLDRESFTYGVSQPVVPLVRRVIAENPSKFTYFGTGTYIVGGDVEGRGDVVVIDPGPRLDAHRDALAAALEGCSVRAILVTHCHADHSPLACVVGGRNRCADDRVRAPRRRYVGHRRRSARTMIRRPSRLSRSRPIGTSRPT